MSITPNGMLSNSDLRVPKPNDCKISHAQDTHHASHVDDKRSKGADTTVGNVLEHGKDEIEICARVRESLLDLVPLPSVVANPLRVDRNPVDRDRLFALVEPSNRELRVWQGVHVDEAGDKGKQAKLGLPYCARRVRIKRTSR